jgi:alpha-2-macroglobulin
MEYDSESLWVPIQLSDSLYLQRQTFDHFGEIRKMRTNRIIRFALIVILLVLAVAGCRRARPTDEATSEATPTAEIGEVTATTEPSVEPTSPPTTSVPAGQAVPVEAIDWPPMVVVSDPLPGEETPLDTPITLRFDQPMDQASVESAFAIEPALSGDLAWPAPDTVVFNPTENLVSGQTYNVRVAGSASGLNGQPLLEPFEMMVQAVNPVRVTQVIPDDDSDRVQTDAVITVVFDAPVVPLVSTGEQAGLPQSLTFDPPVAGTGEWISTSIYRFIPDPPLAGATTYTVGVDPDLTNFLGGMIEDPPIWQFTTLNPEVVTVFPENEAVGIAPTTTISVTFNMPMDTAATASAINLSGAETGSVGLSYEWENEDRTVVLQPDDLLPLDTELTLTIDAGARAANGQASMERPHTSMFTTVPFPAVISTTPSDGSTGDPFQQGFHVEFAGPMDDATILDQFIIEPDPGQVNYFINEWENYYAVYVEFDQETNTRYTVTIPGTAADPYGNTLGEDYVFSYDSPPYLPMASFNLPRDAAQLSTSFPSDVQITYRNVSELKVNLYDVGVDVNLLTNTYLMQENAADGDPIFTTTIPVTLPEDELGVMTVRLADGGTLPTGVYRLEVEAPEVRSEDKWWQNQKVLLIVADTNLVVKEMFGEVNVWATDLATGQPAPGRNITVYNRNGVEAGIAVTDANGFATLAYEPPEPFLDGVVAVSNQPGEAGFGLALSYWQGVSPWQLGLFADTSSEQPLYTYLYTDRPIYRPGDTVYYKGIVRETNFGRYTISAVEQLDLYVGPNSFMGESYYSDEFTVTLDADGVFSGELVLPADMPLGEYSFSFPGRDMWTSTRAFTVAEYRAPEFEVTVTPDAGEVLRGTATNVTVQAEYLFGGSASGLPVHWNVNEARYDPVFANIPGYVFGDQAGFFYKSYSPFSPQPFPGATAYLGDGNAETDATGQVIIPLPADLLENVDAGTREVTVEATVGGLGEFPVSGRTSITFHAAEVYAGLQSINNLVDAGDEATVDLLTVDWDGQPVGEQMVEVVFYRRDWQSERIADSGMRYTAWTPVDTEVARESVTTGSDGRATVSFTPDSGGSYLVVSTLTDSTGREQLSSLSIWSVDENFAGWRTDPNQRSMEITADKRDYTAGETAQLLVQSPFAQPVQAWMVVERGTLIDQQVVTIDGSTVIELPIVANYAPNVFVTIVAVKPVDQSDPNFPYADIRVGYVELVVAPEQFDLNVTITPGQEVYAPGDTATFDVAVTDQAGNPVQAEVSLALVDLAVLLLKEDNAPPILDFFYTPQPLRSNTGSGLFITGEGLEIEEPLPGGGFGGGGGGDEAAGSFRLEDEEGVRRDFRDTAYWEARLMTDAGGRASVEVPLPDNVTTWRMHSKAATTGTEVGQASADIVSRRPLIVRPVTPRFFTVGDTLALGANVNNNTGSAIEATVSLEANGLIIDGDAEQVVNVPADGRVLVRWDVTVEDVAAADIIFRVEGGGFSDASKPTMGVGPNSLLPIYRYDGRDFVATAGELDEAGRRVEAVLLPEGVNTRRGNVNIKMQPSLAAAIIESFDVLEDTFPFYLECPGWLADRLLHNLAVERAIADLNLNLTDLSGRLSTQSASDLPKLVKQQLGDGGWGWCLTSESDPWISAQALLVLTQAADLGYEVSSDVISAAADYVDKQLEPINRIGDAYEANRQAFFLYVLANAGQNVVEDADAMVDEHRALMDPYAKALLAMAYDLNDAAGPNQSALLDDLNDSAIMSATGAHWEDDEQDVANLSSDIRGTAIVIQALARLQPDSPLLPPAVRWLMVARTAETWPTLHQTAWSVSGLTDWMAVSGELEADYGYELRVNLQPEASGRFTPDDVTESEEVEIPINQLVVEETNFFDFQRGAGDGRLYYTLRLDSAIGVEYLDPVNKGFTVERRYFDADCDAEVETCEPIESIAVDERVRVELTVTIPNDRVYVLLEDPIPAGTDAIDPNLLTSQSGLGGQIVPEEGEFGRGYWGWWYFDHIQYRDEKVVFLSQYLPAGTYQYTYYLQANIPGTYQVMPATAREEYFPEVFGRSEGMIFTIEE